jgi:hypothetical protein
VPAAVLPGGKHEMKRKSLRFRESTHEVQELIFQLKSNMIHTTTEVTALPHLIMENKI